MPKVVDKDARRREIIECYLRIIAEAGAEAATTRRICAELGISHGSLWHYFESFDALVSQAYQLVFARTNERITEANRDRSGVRALLAMLEQIHPLDRLTEDESYVVIGYWGRVAARHEDGTHRAFLESRWMDGFRTHMAQAVAAGELVARTPIRELVDILTVLARGYQVERVLETPLAAHARQWRAVEAVLAPWLTPLGREHADFAAMEGMRR